MLSMPTLVTSNPKRFPHVPAFAGSARTVRAIAFDWEGSWEMRYSSDSELTATLNDWMNSDRICRRAPGSSNEYEVTFAGTKLRTKRTGSVTLSDRAPRARISRSVS